MPIKDESTFHHFDKYRTHGDKGLCVIFRYAGEEKRLTELTGNFEDHFKIPASDLPYRVHNMMGKRDVRPTESWSALLVFEEQCVAVRKRIEHFKTTRDFSKHSEAKIDWLLQEGIEAARTEVCRLVEKYKLGRVEDGCLVFNSYETSAKHARKAYKEKLEKIETRSNRP